MDRFRVGNNSHTISDATRVNTLMLSLSVAKGKRQDGRQQRVGQVRNDPGDAILLPVIQVVGTLDQSSIYAAWASG